MDRPTECKWCGAAKRGEDGDDILFKCGSWHSGSTPEFQWIRCELNVANDRIQRALDKIKASKRWSVEKISKTPIEYYVDPDGWIAQASDLDDVARILEGDADV